MIPPHLSDYNFNLDNDRPILNTLHVPAESIVNYTGNVYWNAAFSNIVALPYNP